MKNKENKKNAESSKIKNKSQVETNKKKINQTRNKKIKTPKANRKNKAAVSINPKKKAMNKANKSCKKMNQISDENKINVENLPKDGIPEQTTVQTKPNFTEKNSKKKKHSEENSEIKTFKCIPNKRLNSKSRNYTEGATEILYQHFEASDQTIPIEDRPRTILEILNDTKTGIPMSSELKIKKTKKKNKSESDNSETFSIINSEISGNRSEKPFLRSKTHRDNNVEPTSPNYASFFKPKLKWCPLTNKMIIEKPSLQEASMKMQEEIMKNEYSLTHHSSDAFKLTSSSFKKTLHTDKWSKDETLFFYKALECFGTDFSFLEIVLKPRNRSQIKNKFRKEEKENAAEIEAALKKHDPSKLSKLLNVFKEFKEEMSYKQSRKVNKKKTSSNENPREFDFKKLIMTSDLKEDCDVQNALKEITEEDEDELEEEEEKENNQNDDKTVSVIYESSIEEEPNEYSNLKVKTENKSSYKINSNEESVLQNSTLTNSRKTSKVKVIINEGIEKRIDSSNEIKESILSFDFLKSFN